MKCRKRKIRRTWSVREEIRDVVEFFDKLEYSIWAAARGTCASTSMMAVYGSRYPLETIHGVSGFLVGDLYPLKINSKTRTLVEVGKFEN